MLLMTRLGFVPALPAILVSFAALAAEQSRPELRLIPSPRQVTQTQGTFPFTAQTTIRLGQPDDEQDRFAAGQLIEEAAKDFQLNLRIAEPAASQPAILIGRVENKVIAEALVRHGVELPRQFNVPYRDQIAPQAYALAVSSNGIVLAGGGAAGVFYGCQTLKQLLRANARGAALPGCRIVDWPSLAYRCWQDDISRGPIPTLEFLKRQVVTLSEFKLNALTLYTENVFKNPRHPKIAPADGLTAEEVRELCAYARKHHVEVLGNHQAFGHYEKTLRLPEYAHLRENDHVLTPAKEETYRFLTEILDVIAPAYESPLFVINCDETFGLGEGPSKDMVRELGLGGVYASHIQRLHKILQPHGKTPLMWGDIALNHRDIVPRLPKDLIVLSWGYGARPAFDDAIRPFTEMGFRFWVCPGVSSWVWIWPDHRTATINIANYVRDGERHGAMGMLNTTWGDDGEQFFNYTWHPQIWAAEVSWLPARPPGGAPDMATAGAKLDPEWLKAAESERERRLAVFDRAFPSVFFGLGDDTASQAIWKLDRVRTQRLAGGLLDRAFWQDPLQLPQSAPARLQAQADQLCQEAADTRSAFIAARQNARFNADALDFAAFAARRVAFLGLRTKARLAIATAWDKSAGQKDQAVAALRGPVHSELLALLNEAQQLRAEYARLWPLENRPLWLETVLGRYDGLIRRLDGTVNEVTKAAAALEKESVWPDSAHLCLDFPSTTGRSTAAAPAAADPKTSAADWHWRKATHRLPIVWDTGKTARTEAPLELVVPPSALLQSPAARFSFAMTELCPEGRQEVVPAQFEALTNGSLRLTAILAGTTQPAQQRRFFLYAGPLADLPAASIPGAVSVKVDGQGGFWVENDRYRARIMPEGAHVYAFHVKAADDLDVTAAGETDWRGFSDIGSDGRKAACQLSLESAGPVLARIRCTSKSGLEKVLNFWAGCGWYEVVLEQAVPYYWDFDDLSVMNSQNATPGKALFSDGRSFPLPKPGQLSLAQPGTVWGLKRRSDALTLALITPGAPGMHRVGPGDGMGGVGVEGSGDAWHFVTLCDVVPGDPAAVCNALAATLDLRNQPKVTIRPAQAR